MNDNNTFTPTHHTMQIKKKKKRRSIKKKHEKIIGNLETSKVEIVPNKI